MNKWTITSRYHTPWNCFPWYHRRPWGCKKYVGPKLRGLQICKELIYFIKFTTAGPLIFHLLPGLQMASAVPGRCKIIILSFIGEKKRESFIILGKKYYFLWKKNCKNKLYFGQSDGVMTAESESFKHSNFKHHRNQKLSSCIWPRNEQTIYNVKFVGRRIFL